MVAGYALGPLDSLRGEREHLVGAALRTLGRVLPDVTGTDHLIHPPPRRVGMSLEVSLGQIAGGDVAVHAHVRYRPIRPVLEGLPLRPAGIVFAPVAGAFPLLPIFGVVAPGASFGPGPGIAGYVSWIEHGSLLNGSARRRAPALARAVGSVVWGFG